jgi:tetrahydromethanopterin S-methyltransferase subunit A
MDKTEAILELAAATGIDRDPSGLYERLIDYLNNLADNNFEKLISLLYRMDIDEEQIRKMLRANPDTNAGVMIAELMIVRQVQKIESRRKFNQRDNNIDENDKW